MPASMKHIVSVPWTDEERALLRQLWENGLGPVLIGRLMGRSKYSVTKQTQALQCRLPSHASDHHSHYDPAPAPCRRCHLN